MSGRWFRMYDDVINDPKVMRLPEALRWHWVALLCVASKHGGKLPSTDDLAFTLRMKVPQVAAILTELHVEGLLDRAGDGFAPHNWDVRQYKSDTSNDRVKRFRERKRNENANVTCNVTSPLAVTAPEQKQKQTTEQNRIDDDAEERRPGVVSPQAIKLTEQVLRAAGHDPAFWPPGWVLAGNRVQMWIDQGWPAEIILGAVKATAARKSGSPASSVNYFEKAIAEEVARQAKPLPTVTVQAGEQINVVRENVRRETLVDVAKRFAEGGLVIAPKPSLFPRSDIAEPSGEEPVRLLSHGRRE